MKSSVSASAVFDVNTIFLTGVIFLRQAGADQAVSALKFIWPSD